MDIIIAKSPVIPPYGQVSIADLTSAADHLSDSGFKAWVLLAMNQNGFRWNGELSHSVASELERWGFLVPLDDGSNIFCPSGDADGGAHGFPAAWTKIAELYGVHESEYSRIANKLDRYHLIEKVDSILAFWAESYNDLQMSVDHSQTKNPLLFDLSVVLVWWIRGHFTFKVGDVIVTGRDGEKLRYHDAAFQCTVQSALSKKMADRVPITEQNTDCWTKALMSGKFELSPATVGDILRSRRGCEKTA